MLGYRSFSGNFDNGWDEPGKQIRYRGPRKLVEECEAISVHAVQKTFGKKALIAAIRGARPFWFRVPGGHFVLSFVHESHRLPGRENRWSSLEAGTARLWLVCPGCQQPAAKLFFYYVASDSLAHSELRCRRCHGLTYLSANSSGNRWYLDIARPLKRLLREKHKLLGKQASLHNTMRLARIEDEIRTLRQMGAPKTPRDKFPFRPASHERRPYRDLTLLEQWAQGIV